MPKEKKANPEPESQPVSHPTDSIKASQNNHDSTASQAAQPAHESGGETPASEGQIIIDSVFSAALNGKADLVKAALEHGFRVDHQDPEGRTALMLSAFNGHTEIVRMLLAKGAKVDLQDTKDGSTALMFAASGPTTEIVKMLVDAGAKVDMADNNKHFTPLMWAAEEGHIENVKYLLSKGANPLLKDIDAQTAETFATRFNYGEIVKILQAVSRKK